jgi:putative hydrolase of the HAD superfamily
MIKTVVFDFGGVLAEEGFKEGLKVIGKKNGLDPDDFYAVAGELVYQTGYVTGMADESEFWNAVREKTGITGDDEALRSEILERFILRPDLLRYVEKLRSSGLIPAILSDQTNWLDEINQKTPFFHYFDYIFNSFKLKKGKRDPSVFTDICSTMGLQPKEVLFADDNIENIKRALGAGLNALHFTDIGSFQREVSTFLKT